MNHDIPIYSRSICNMAQIVLLLYIKGNRRQDIISYD